MDPRYVAAYNSSSVFDFNTDKSKTNLNEIQYPKTESLRMCEKRAFGYWTDVIAPRVRSNERVLIVAHANTIRSLVKAVDGISEENLKFLKIPNGIPLVYTLDDNLKPIPNSEIAGTEDQDLGFQAKYLVSGRNHPKMMEYERCVKKKMTALFEYLDVNGDGKLTADDLHTGLIRLDSRELGMPLCEYSVDELMRCIPGSEDSGGVNLKAFLDAEQSLLPQLTRLMLLK